jgi:predicted kinase
VEQEAIRTSFETGYDVIIDATNVRAADRWYFMNIAKAYEPKLVCYNFGSGDEYSLARRLKEPRGIPEKRWRDVHELKLKSFEVPIHEEGFDRIYFVDNGVFREIPKPISDGEIKSHREMTLTDVVEFGKDES